jgi:Sigma-70 region 2
MNSGSIAEITLDDLAAAWLGGDSRSETLLFENLRVRFLGIAKRRVQQDHLEDLVQDALQIVLRKAREQHRAENILVWSLTILRNVIGNHYQARRRETERMVTGENILDNVADTTAGPDPLPETAAQLEQALTTLAERFPRCGQIFAGILASLENGGGQREVSQRALESVQRRTPELTRGGFYTALHRCRSQLRALLDKESNHV